MIEGRAAEERSFGCGEPLIEVRGLCKKFGGVSVLNGIDATVAKGERLAYRLFISRNRYIRRA